MSEQISDPKIKEGPDNFVEVFEHRKLIHDLRNALSPILMQAQLLARYAETPGEDAEAIKKSAEAIERNVKDIVKLLDSK